MPDRNNDPQVEMADAVFSGRKLAISNIKIGEFSKPSRVSVRMLRHYDEIGLLKPAEIDRFTDYRYYREGQLPMAGRIAALKDKAEG